MKKPLTNFGLVIAVLLTLITTFSTGCSSKKPIYKMLGAFDNTGYLYNKKNGPDVKPDYMAPLIRAAQLYPGQIDYDLYLFAQDVGRAYTGIPASIDQLAPAIRKIEDAPVSKKEGTNYAPVLRLVKSVCASSKQLVFVMILTDGALDDPAETAIAAKDLENEPMLGGVFIGTVIIGDFRTRLERQLQPIWGKVTVCSDQDMSPKLTAFFENMEKAGGK